MNHPGPRHAFETFHPGMTFNAGDYNEGTILALRREYLASDNPRQANKSLAAIEFGPADVLRGIPPATKDFAPYPAADIMYNRGWIRQKVEIAYTNSLVWGVITANSKGDPMTVLIPPTNVLWNSRPVRVYSSTLLMQQTVAIDQVEHTKQGNMERLSRISLLRSVATATLGGIKSLLIF